VNNFYLVIVRVPKEDSAFLYFTLEANEGICYYSTLDYETGTTFRDIDIQGSPEFFSSLMRILDSLQSKIDITLLKKEAHCEL
jgi:hypothetical protein